MTTRAWLLVGVMGLVAACGDGKAPATADDAAGDLGDDVSDGADSDVTDGMPDETSGPEPGGIVRDADGDGKPDDASAGCAGKNETSCKITAGCAWTDSGECGEANDGGM